MTSTSRPRRSVLYLPGSRTRALEKARSLPADALILDLEDAVSPDEKAAARRLVAAATGERGFGPREVVIRINALDTPWGEEDLQAACAAGPDAILVPKANSAADIHTVEQKMQRMGAPARTTIWAMMETPPGVLNAREIAAASPRLACLVMGTNDLVKDMHAAHTPERSPILTALSICLLAARAHGLACIDGVFNALEDDDGLRAACRQALEMGFDGKTLIHPAQIAAANEVFAPSHAALEEARAQIAAHDAALARGEAVAVLDGHIVENLHVENARRLLSQAEAITALEKAAER